MPHLSASQPPTVLHRPHSVNSLIVAAVKTAARVRTTPYLSVHIRTPLRGKQAFAQDVLSQGARLWCSNRVSDKSDWSDVSDLPPNWYRVRIGTDGYGGGGNNPTGGGAVRAESYTGGRCRPTAHKPYTAHNERQLSDSGGCCNSRQSPYNSVPIRTTPYSNARQTGVRLSYRIVERTPVVLPEIVGQVGLVGRV